MNNLFKTMTSSGKSSTANDEGMMNPKTDHNHAEELDKVFVRNLHVPMNIGITDEEQSEKQTVIVNIELNVKHNAQWQTDNIDTVLSYADIKEGVEKIAKKPFRLLETAAEYIADFCLNFEKCITVRIRAEKPDIFAETDGVGIEIFRTKGD